MFGYLLAILFITHGIGHLLGIIEMWTLASLTGAEFERLFMMAPRDQRRNTWLLILMWAVCAALFITSGFVLIGANQIWRVLAAFAALLSMTMIIASWHTLSGRTRIPVLLLDVSILLALLFNSSL